MTFDRINLYVFLTAIGVAITAHAAVFTNHLSGMTTPDWIIYVMIGSAITALASFAMMTAQHRRNAP